MESVGSSSSIRPVIEFADFRLDPQQRKLCRLDGTPLALHSRAFDTLLALVVFGRRLGLRDHGPVALVFALLDAQIAVGERRHAPQGRCAIALDLQFERHHVAARQHCELRRPLLALALTPERPFQSAG